MRGWRGLRPFLGDLVQGWAKSYFERTLVRRVSRGPSGLTYELEPDLTPAPETFKLLGVFDPTVMPEGIVQERRTSTLMEIIAQPMIDAVAGERVVVLHGTPSGWVASRAVAVLKAGAFA